jgi:hypothetical protein
MWAETKPDRVFEESLFWIQTRAIECNYCMGHCEMLLEVAGLDKNAVAERTRQLGGSDWSAFPAEEQRAYAYARKLSMSPWDLTPDDYLTLEKDLGPDKAMATFWWLPKSSGNNPRRGTSRNRGQVEINVHARRVTDYESPIDFAMDGSYALCLTVQREAYVFYFSTEHANEKTVLDHPRVCVGNIQHRPWYRFQILAAPRAADETGNEAILRGHEVPQTSNSAS